MTLMATALTPCCSTVSTTSFCLDGSPESGLRKYSSTSYSEAALFAPASAIVQNDSGLLLTKATRGLLEPPLQPTSAKSANAAVAQTSPWRAFMIAAVSGKEGAAGIGPAICREHTRRWRGGKMGRWVGGGEPPGSVSVLNRKRM